MSGFSINEKGIKVARSDNGQYIKLVKGGKTKDIKLDDIKPVIDDTVYKRNQREVYLISGISGAGKSTIAGHIAQEYRNTYPNHKIVVISPVKYDENFDEIDDVIRVELDDDFVDNQSGSLDFERDDYNPNKLDINDFEESLVIFDDVETIYDKKIRNIVLNLRNMMLERGRHHKISMLVINHQIMNYQQTKILNNEANKVILFPKSGAKGQIRNYLKKYCGFTNNEVKTIVDLESRWILISRASPMYIMYEDGVFIFD